MPLEDYERKRDFSQTPEPGPVIKSSPHANTFVIQKHAARRLHYDLRLELGGMLKSWAVPKGPSLDPSEKRLAVHVEDHPLDYAGFEGTIPAGEYGAGTVIVWDRGYWYPVGDAAEDPERAYREGKLKFRLEGEKLHGAWMLLRLGGKRNQDKDKDNWLLFKERDDEARAGDDAAVTVLLPDSVATGRSLEDVAEGGRATSAPLHDSAAVDPAALQGARRAPAPVGLAPELATLVGKPPEGDAWLHEIKFDGYRVMCRLEMGSAQMLTRRGADWTSHFPILLDAVQRIPAQSAILDGEVVYVQPDGRTSFLELASALQSGTDVDGRIVYYVFDLPYLDGYDLTRVPLHLRKTALRGLLAAYSSTDRVRYVEHVRGSGDDFLEQACEFALEGEIAKRWDSFYRPGRGRDWLKVKCMHRQEFVVGGFTGRANHADEIGALLLGFHDRMDGPLLYAGRVGTGWDERSAGELRSRLEAVRVDKSPFVNFKGGKREAGVVWVRPELVVEVEYLSWNAGGVLRHASFEGLRLDKLASEVVAESEKGDPLQPLTPPAAALTPPPEEAAAAHPPQPDAEAQASESAAATVVSEGAGVDKGGGKDGARRRKKGDGVAVAGVVITNPGRMMYPELGLTKLDLAHYYEDVATWMLPHVSRRPLTMVRCPEGHGRGCFFQKHAVDQFPEAIRRVPIQEEDGVATYVAIDSTAGLLSLVQMGVLEFHVWGSHMETLEYPDQVVFDLDPDPDLPFVKVIEGARLLRSVLEDLGLQSFVKTTGGKGLHVVVPVMPSYRWDEVKPVTKAIAEAVVRADPSAFVANMSLARRKGKIFVDYLRNGRGATYISAFSTRRRPGAPVAATLRWDELTAGLRADKYRVDNLRRRLSQLHEDPWRGYDAVHQEMGPALLATVEAMFALHR